MYPVNNIRDLDPPRLVFKILRSRFFVRNKITVTRKGGLFESRKNATGNNNDDHNDTEVEAESAQEFKEEPKGHFFL